ncbi:MAG: oligopeptide/dipeptide ABC transporter ATP-binding protein [Candidatus Hodarchaeota archaeon]
MSFFGIAFRNVQRNRWRSFLLILGITLSVTLETGIAISIDSLYENFITDHRMQNYTDLRIHSISNTSTIEEMRNVATTVESISGVSKASAIVTHIISDETLEFLGYSYNITNNIILYGCESNHPDFQNIVLIKGNRSLENNGVIISNHLANEFGATIGQNDIRKFSHLIPGISGSVTINGIMKDNINLGNLFGYLYILVDLDFLYEKLLETKWRFDVECVVKIDNLIEINEIATRIEIILGENYTILRGKIISDLSQMGIGSYQSAMNMILLASFVVTILFLTNVLAINVNERKKEFGILRSVGTSNFQLIRTLAIELLVYCLIGSLLGNIIGVFFSIIFINIFNQIEQTVTITNLTIKLTTIGIAFAAGMLISLIAGIYPILHAILLPPVQNIHYQQRNMEHKWKITWKYFFLAGFSLCAIGFFGTNFIGPPQFLSFEIFSFHFIIIVIILIGTLLILTGLLKLLPRIGMYLFWHSTISKVLSSRNVKQEMSKSLITILTSGTALSFILIIGIVSNALIETVPSFYTNQFGGIDILAECYDGQELPLTVADKLSSKGGIIETSFIQEARITLKKTHPERINIFGIDPVEYETFMDPIIVQTKPTIVAMMNTSEQGVIISDLLMKNLNVGLKDKIEIILDEINPVQLTVNGVARGNPFIRDGLYLYMSNILFNQLFPPKNEPVAKWFVMLIDDTHEYDITTYLTNSYEEFSQVISINFYSDLIEGALQRQAILFQILFFESFFLVGLAQFVCILISTIKMEREIAIIRALGLSKKEVFSTFFAESTLLGVTGVIIGVIEGIIGSYLIGWYISPSIPIKISFDPFMIVFWVVFSLTITLLSSSIPSYRSSNKSVVEAIYGREFKEISYIDDTVPEEELLIVENLKGYYKGIFGIVHGVDDVSLKIKRGEIVGLAGESGCGKSTLAELITGTPRPLLHYEEGNVILDKYKIFKTDPEILRIKIKCKLMSYVPQASMESLNPVKKIKDFIMDVVWERTGKKGTKKEVFEFAENHFERVGLDRQVLDRYPFELSGGMKQRVVIAISTMWNPHLLIIDEPTSALDVTSQKRMIKMLADLKDEGIIQSILFVSHDIATLRQLCDRCIIMYCGEIVESGSMNDIINKPLNPYTQGLISSIVSFNPDGTRPTELRSIPGNQPDLRNPPPGCRFHPRCSLAMSHCKTEEPPIFKQGNKDHRVKCWLYK